MTNLLENTHFKYPGTNSSKKMSTLSFILFLFCLGSTLLEPLTPKIGPGLIYEKIHAPFLKHGTIHLKITLEPPSELIKTITDMTTLTTALKTQLEESDLNKNSSAYGDAHGQVLASLHELLHVQTLPWFSRLGSDPQKGNSSLEGKVGPIRRKKRGLVDGGGRILKWAFGVATTTDLDNLKKNFNTYKSITIASHYELHKHSKQIQILADAIRGVAGIMASDTRKNLLRDIKLKLQHIEIFITRIVSTAHVVETAMHLASLGRVHSGVVDPSLFLGVVQLASHKLMLHPVLPLDTRRFRSYLRLCTVVAVSDEWGFTVEIPLRKEGTVEAFRVYSFPSVANTTGRYQLHGTPGLVFLTDLQTYTYSNVQDECREHVDMVVCDGSVPSTRRQFDHCLGPLVKGGDGTGCQYDRIGHNDPIWIRTENYWAVSVRGGLHGILKCNNSDTGRPHLFSGMFLIPYRCTFLSEVLR